MSLRRQRPRTSGFSSSFRPSQMVANATMQPFFLQQRDNIRNKKVPLTRQHVSSRRGPAVSRNNVHHSVGMARYAQQDHNKHNKHSKHSNEHNESSKKSYSVAKAIQHGLAASAGPLSEAGGLCPGTSVKDFDILKLLGRGAHGVVHLAKSKVDGQYYVLKDINVANLKDHRRKRVVSEVLLLRRLRHPNIIQYYTSFVDSGSLYIVMEYANAGDMYTELKIRGKECRPVSEEQVWDYFQQTAAGLQYLHSKNIIHRDVKSMNIFLTDDGQIKLGDLGVSRLMEDDRAAEMSRVGTPMYFAPELIKREAYDYRVDVWSLGCLVYTIMQLQPPFRADNIYSLAVDIVKKPPAALPRMYSSALRRLVSLMLEKFPSKRPSINQLIEQFPSHLKESMARVERENENTDQYDQKKQQDVDLGSTTVSTISLSTGLSSMPMSSKDGTISRRSGSPLHHPQTAAAWGTNSSQLNNNSATPAGNSKNYNGTDGPSSSSSSSSLSIRDRSNPLTGGSGLAGSIGTTRASSVLEAERRRYNRRSSRSSHVHGDDRNYELQDNQPKTESNSGHRRELSARPLSPRSMHRRRGRNNTSNTKTRPASASIKGRHRPTRTAGKFGGQTGYRSSSAVAASSAKRNVFSVNGNAVRRRPASAHPMQRRQNASTSNESRKSNQDQRRSAPVTKRESRNRPASASHHRRPRSSKVSIGSDMMGREQKESLGSSSRRQRPQSAAPSRRQRKDSIESGHLGGRGGHGNGRGDISHQARAIVVKQWQPTFPKKRRPK